jgi:hypothetical protein
VHSRDEGECGDRRRHVAVVQAVQAVVAHIQPDAGGDEQRPQVLG